MSTTPVLSPGQIIVPSSSVKLFTEPYFVRRRFRIVFNYDREILKKIQLSKLWKLMDQMELVEEIYE